MLEKRVVNVENLPIIIQLYCDKQTNEIKRETANNVILSANYVNEQSLSKEQMQYILQTEEAYAWNSD